MAFFWHILFLVSNWFPTILSYNLVFGKGKILYFGPMGMVLLTAYPMVITLMHTGSFLLAFLVGFAFSIIASLLFAWLSLRLEADAFGILSIAVHLSLISVVLNWQSMTRGALGIPGVPKLPFLQTPMNFALCMLAVGLVWIFCMLKIDRSAFGRKLQALAEHTWHAKSLGIDQVRVHIVAFLISGLSTTVTGFFWVQYIGLLHPNDYLFPTLVFYVMVTVAGGPGSVRGVTLSAILLLILKEFLRFVPLSAAILGPVRLMLFGIILFVAVWWRRDTLFPKQRSI